MPGAPCRLVLLMQHGAPRNGIVEIAGPERARLADMVQRFLNATHDSRKAVEDAQARYFGAKLQDDTLCPGANPRVGAMNFDKWFAQSQYAKWRRRARHACGRQRDTSHNRTRQR